jgi:hypothetical protein
LAWCADLLFLTVTKTRGLMAMAIPGFP